jgi:hypothetical protein
MSHLRCLELAKERNLPSVLIVEDDLVWIKKSHEIRAALESLEHIEYNVAVLAPAATTTDAGTGTAVVLELFSATVTPPVPAAAERVTVPVTFVEPFPVMDVVLSVRLESVATAAGVTVRVAVLETPLVPVRVTDVLAVTA